MKYWLKFFLMTLVATTGLHSAPKSAVGALLGASCDACEPDYEACSAGCELRQGCLRICDRAFERCQNSCSCDTSVEVVWEHEHIGWGFTGPNGACQSTWRSTQKRITDHSDCTQTVEVLNVVYETFPDNICGG
jgi:hypothetical protein